MRVVVVILLVVVLAVAGTVMWALSGLGSLLQGSAGADDSQEQLQTLLARHKDAFLADLAVVDQNAALAAKEGGDAGAVLNAKVPWRSQSAAVNPLKLEERLQRALLGEMWTTVADLDGVVDVDSSLLQGLGAYATWDITKNLPAEVAPAASLLEMSMPAYVELRAVARAHLLQPLAKEPKEGTTSFAERARDVENFARLAGTSTLIGGLIATALFEDVAEAHAAAAAAGRAGDHVVAVDDATVERMKRAWMAAPAYLLHDDDAAQKILASKSVVPCAVINEVMFQLDLVRGFDDEQPRRAQIEAARQQKKQACVALPSTSGEDMMCASSENATTCRRQLAVLKLPILRGKTKHTLMQIAGANYLGAYEKKEKEKEQQK